MQTNNMPAGLRGRAIFGKGEKMSDLISRQVLDLWDRYKPTIAVDAIEYDKELKKLLGADLAEVGTDCISRQALLDKFEPWLKVKDYNDGELNMLKAVLCEIRFMRPAQPERIKGRWTRDNACSECGCQPWFSGDIHNYNFCPHCGADMRGEQDDSV